MSERVILVPLDGSEAALAALPVAKVLGQIEQAELHLVHVAETQPRDRAGLSRLAHPELDGLAIDFRSGEAAAEIVHVAQEIGPEMIVLCRHTGSEAPNVLGNTAANVFRDVSCPLVLVPPERGPAPWHLQHILVPHDGTPSTSAAVRPAAELAERAGGDLLAAHVSDVQPAPDEAGSLTTPSYVDQPQHEWPAWSSEFLGRFASICPTSHVQTRITLARGNPAAEIIRLAKEQATDLIVLAWRGQWEVPRAAILKQLLGAAPCPVMVVRT
jgi:nucleotide-binding universal stress UspA family protein